MSEDFVVVAHNLTKTYRLYSSLHDRLKEILHPLGRKYHHAFFALKDVSFAVKHGETFGIIGNNGAGKSTLLKILSGVMTQTSGTMEINGRLSALLELGAGFNREMTGYANVFFQGALLGLERTEVAGKMDSVLAFADIGEYIHQPVKTYSSGMFIRLAFAVSLMINPQVLILDEALAVGDVFFQQKCFKRLQQLQEDGVAILLVSHSMSDIMQHCQRALVLQKGESFFCGDAREAVKKFFILQQKIEEPSNLQAKQEPAMPRPERQAAEESQRPYFWPPPEAFIGLDKALIAADGAAECTAVALCDASGAPCHAFVPGADAYFYYEFRVLADIDIPVGGVVICNHRNIIVHGRNTLEYQVEAPPDVRVGERVRFRQRIKLDIAPGEYTFNVGFSSLPHTIDVRRQTMAHLDVLHASTRLCHVDAVGSFCVSMFPSHQPATTFHNGLCNLAGDAEIYRARATG